MSQNPDRHWHGRCRFEPLQITRPTPDARRAARRAAFTLVEVIIALSVLAVALPAFFRVVQSAVLVGDTIDDLGREFRRREAAELYLRRFFSTLPAATLVSTLENEDGVLLEFPGLYAAPGEASRAMQGWTTRLEPRKQLNGTYSLVLACRGTDPQGSPIETAPLVLARELTGASWRFFIENANVWTENLPQGVRPAMIEIVLRTPRTDEIRWALWVRSRSALGYGEGEN